jgi:hypothetical protein
MDPEHIDGLEVHGIERRHYTGLDLSQAAQQFSDRAKFLLGYDRSDAPQSSVLAPQSFAYYLP